MQNSKKLLISLTNLTKLILNFKQDQKNATFQSKLNFKIQL